MKIFLCWSGERSRQFATAASQFLTNIFDHVVEPVISSDIEKGAVWFEDLSDTLRQARVGLLCLTPEAVGSPWLHFEAGILAKVLHDRPEPAAPPAVVAAPAPPPAAAILQPGVEPVRRSAGLRIFPFLYGVEPSALKGPLTAYQSTLAKDRDDVWRLVEAIQTIVEELPGNATSPEAGRAATRRLREKFESAWLKLVEKLASIKPAKLLDVVPDFESLFRRKTFDESMYDCLNQDWLARYDGARSVEMRLRAQQRTVREACDRYAADMFDAVSADLSAYAMSLAVQLAEPRAPIDALGRVEFQHDGVATACERLRKRIKERVARLIDEQQAPMFQESFHFEASETSFEKKRLILRKSAEIRQRKAAFSEEMNAPLVNEGSDSPPKKHRCRDSEWDFDRIVYYMWVEDTWTDMYVATHLRCARTELEREAGGAGDQFRLPLAYALRVIAKGLPKVADPALGTEARALHQRIVASIASTPADGLADLRQALGDVLATLDAVASSVPEPAA
jgi:hypothetical protein